MRKKPMVIHDFNPISKCKKKGMAMARVQHFPKYAAAFGLGFGSSKTNCFFEFWHVALNRLKIQFVQVLGAPKYLKMCEKTLKKIINFGRFKPMKISRVVMGKSRVDHGFGKPWVCFGNPGFFSEITG